MSKLFLVHDFSSDSTALFAALNRHAPLLAQNSIELGPFNPLLCEAAPTHVALWFQRPENRPLPPHIAAMWGAIAEKLDAGQDVLLFTRRLEPASHEYFWGRLPERVDLERHAPELLFVFGRPSLLLEQYFQTNPAAAGMPFTQTYLQWLENIPATVARIRERAGNARCEYLFNTTESPTLTPQLEILQRAFAFMGCAPPPAPFPDPFARGFRSHQTRRLFQALEVRGNAWPALDAGFCRSALLELDHDSPQDWLCPLELRKDFARTHAPAVSALEALAGAAPGTFAPPEALVSAPHADPAAPLAPALLAAFSAALAPAQRAALRERLVTDEALLTADQKALLKTLTPAGEFSTLGEPEPAPELTVLTMTYNHENFIAQCMEGVLAQKTTFPVRHIVLDHCSQDGTAAIVAEYARKHPSIQPVLLSSHLPGENVRGLFDRCRSKYAALCDGDDYFTEPTKLQKQVDMLEARPDLALCFHPVAAVFDDGRAPVIFPPLSTLPRRSAGGFSLDDLLVRNFIQTNSVVYRWRFREGLPEWFRPDLCPGDYYWHLLHAETGNIGFIPEIMSVYRRHAGAVYAKALTSSAELRRDHGMAELHAYSAYYEHFGDKYFPAISGLANEVFADFLEIAGEGDDSLFTEAVKKYPAFGRAFFNVLNQQKQEARAMQCDAGRKETPTGV